MNSKNARKIFETSSTATLSSILLQHKVSRCWLRGPVPLADAQRCVAGPAFTMQFLPLRDDLSDSSKYPTNFTTRTVIEEMPEGVVAVVSTGGINDVGTFGDILCTRMQRKKVAGLITDGAVRDKTGIRASGLPVWSATVAAPPPPAGLYFAGYQTVIACGGVTIFPGDFIVADEDGAIVIPHHLVEAVARETSKLDQLEHWVIKEVERDLPLPGLYPMNEETRRRYDIFLDQHEKGHSNGN